LPILILTIIIICVDQWSKYYIEQHMTLGMSIPIIENIFHISYVLNPGAAFGILEHRTEFLILIALLMIGGVIYIYPRIPDSSRLLRVGLGLLVGGSIGNVIDRVRTGYVVDFFDFRVWPVFNIADTAIVCGVAFIIFTTIFSSVKEDASND